MLGQILVLSLATSSLAAPPAALVPYIQNGKFDPGHFAWMEGAFPHANPRAKLVWKSIAAWQETCFLEGSAKVRAELSALGVSNPQISPAPYGNSLCDAVSFYRALRADRSSFAAFQRDAVSARQITDTFLFATGLAEEMGGPRGPTLSDKLAARPLGEQILRLGISWGDGEAKAAPTLPVGVRAVVIAELGVAISERDHANTEWLKTIVAKDGWPRRSVVGDHQSDFAWLLVQHADMDPAFQLRALRLMEPLVGLGEVSKQNYAYLYDRVMLKISGKQRYATQMTCTGGHYVPLPLEEAAAVTHRRADAGLTPMPEYLQQMRTMAGDCPSSDGEKSRR